MKTEKHFKLEEFAGYTFEDLRVQYMSLGGTEEGFKHEMSIYYMDIILDQNSYDEKEWGEMEANGGWYYYLLNESIYKLDDGGYPTWIEEVFFKLPNVVYVDTFPYNKGWARYMEYYFRVGKWIKTTL